MTADEVIAILRRCRFNYESERELQDGIAIALRDCSREVKLTEKDRIDFMIGSLGIEVKVDAANAAVLRQLHRYSESPEIASLLLVTNRSRHSLMPRVMNGKPVSVYVLPSL